MKLSTFEIVFLNISIALLVLFLPILSHAWSGNVIDTFSTGDCNSGFDYSAIHFTTSDFEGELKHNGASNQCDIGVGFDKTTTLDGLEAVIEYDITRTSGRCAIRLIYWDSANNKWANFTTPVSVTSSQSGTSSYTFPSGGYAGFGIAIASVDPTVANCDFVISSVTLDGVEQLAASGSGGGTTETVYEYIYVPAESELLSSNCTTTASGSDCTFNYSTTSATSTSYYFSQFSQRFSDYQQSSQFFLLFISFILITFSFAIIVKRIL
jgi:hypothetical protein